MLQHASLSQPQPASEHHKVPQRWQRDVLASMAFWLAEVRKRRRLAPQLKERVSEERPWRWWLLHALCNAYTGTYPTNGYPTPLNIPRTRKAMLLASRWWSIWPFSVCSLHQDGGCRGYGQETAKPITVLRGRTRRMQDSKRSFVETNEAVESATFTFSPRRRDNAVIGRDEPRSTGVLLGTSRPPLSLMISTSPALEASWHAVNFLLLQDAVTALLVGAMLMPPNAWCRSR